MNKNITRYTLPVLPIDLLHASIIESANVIGCSPNHNFLGKVWTTEFCSLGAISFSIIFHDCQKFKYDFHPLLDPKRAPVAIQQQNSNPPLSAKAQEVEKWNRWNENRIRARSGTKTYPGESAGSPSGGGGGAVGGARSGEKPSRSSTLNSTGNHSYSLNSC